MKTKLFFILIFIILCSTAVLAEAPVISELPEIYIFEDLGLIDNIIDLWDYTSDAEDADSDLTFTILSESADSIVSCSIDSNRYLDCTTQTDMFGESEVVIQVEDTEGLTDTDTFTIHVQPVNDAPEVSDIPDQEIDEGEEFEEFDLDDYVTDDNSDSDIVWTITGNTDLDVDIDADNLVIINYPDDWTGSETITFTAEDPEGLTDSATATFEVEGVANTAPKLDDIPDQVLDKDSGLNDDLVDLWDYASDDESSDSELDFTIKSQTNEDVVFCSIEDNRYLECEVEDDETGYSYVVVKVEDPKGLSDAYKLKVEVVDDEEDDEDSDIRITSMIHEIKVDAGSYMHFNVYVKGDTTGIRTTVYIEGLDIYETFNKLKNIYLQIPEDAPAGKYYLKVMVKNKAGYIDAVYREVEVINDAIIDSGDDDTPVSGYVPAKTTQTMSSQEQPNFYLQGFKGIIIGLSFMLVILVSFLLLLRFKSNY